MVEEEASCTTCEGHFTRSVTKIGGKVQGYPRRICPECHDRRHQTVEVAGNHRDTPLDALEKAGVNVRKHGECRLDNWQPGESTTPFAACRVFADDVIAAGRHTFVRGLYLCGDTGTGKTHLAVATLYEIVDQPHPPSVLFDRADRLITEIQDTYGTGGTDAVLRKREQATVWVVDDLGAEKATENVLRILTDLMSAREGHPTIITSNLDPTALSKRWDSQGRGRLLSRLAPQNFRTVAVKGRDRRFAA